GGIWYGLGAPKAMPAEIVDKLNKEVNAALDDPKMKARLADLGGVALPGSPAEVGKLIADETEKWAKLIKFAVIKAHGCGRLDPIFHKSSSAKSIEEACPRGLLLLRVQRRRWEKAREPLGVAAPAARLT